MKSISFNSGWTCTAYGQTAEVTLPHDYMIGAVRDGANKTGPDIGYFMPDRAVYTKEFELAEAEETTLLRFDGVMGLCEVTLNDHRLAFHPYGYTAFVVDLGPALRPGKNTLTVTADTTAQQASRWYTGGGLYRNVDLLTAGNAYIAPWGLFVQTRHLRGASAEIGVQVTAVSDRARRATIELTIAGGVHSRHVLLSPGENAFDFRFTLDDITPWSVETPVLYACDARLITDTENDSASVSFGVRTVEVDARRGLLLNGEPIKLYGGCVHHDNGIVGAASYAAAEERRVRILKAQGFNAIRCAHNPPSTAMLDVCDRLGMLVIDEIFDCWRVAKKDFDYHIWFDAYWEADTRSMVLRDRNHPSIVIWSTGNEIVERTGRSEGHVTHKRIADLIRALDPTRPLTNAVCDLWESAELGPRETDQIQEGWDAWAWRTAPLIEVLDVAGYNYLLHRLDGDEATWPDRLIMMTESFPMDAGTAKKRMDADPRFVGEFVWTSWDYFGETCIGTVRHDGVEKTFGYPNHIANCGDLDICGFKKPQSYYRDAMWRKDSVTVLSAPPSVYGQPEWISRWGFYDVDRTWTWPGEEGKPTTVLVFSLCPEVELFLNGVSLGRKTPDEQGVARFEAVYQPGTLTARAYRDGACVGEDGLSTVGAWKDIDIRYEPTDADDLCYAVITLVDGEGRADWTACDKVTVTAAGGTVIGTGSGRIDDDHIYPEPGCRAWHGRLLCAVRPEGGDIELTATAGAVTRTVRISR